MTINPFILLFLGAFFALLYGVVITVGWAQTRRNRRALQDTLAISVVPVWLLDQSLTDAPKTVRIPSLSANKFVDQHGGSIDLNNYSPFIAIGTSAEYKNIESGDLVLKDESDTVRYVFKVPDLTHYR